MSCRVVFDDLILWPLAGDHVRGKLKKKALFIYLKKVNFIYSHVFVFLTGFFIIINSRTKRVTGIIIQERNGQWISVTWRLKFTTNLCWLLHVFKLVGVLRVCNVFCIFINTCFCLKFSYRFSFLYIRFNFLSSWEKIAKGSNNQKIKVSLKKFQLFLQILRIFFSKS